MMTRGIGLVHLWCFESVGRGCCMTRLNVGAGRVGRGRRAHKILGRVPKYESWNPILQQTVGAPEKETMTVVSFSYAPD